MHTYKPTTSLANAQARAKMYAQIREFFSQHNVLEVDTPVMSYAGVTDVYLQSVTTNFSYADKQQKGYLQTSPEFPMKRLLSAWQVPIFQIAKVFRDNERGNKHNIEFSMLEWYLPQQTLAELQQQLNDMVNLVLGTNYTFTSISYREAFLQYAGFDPFTTSLNELKQHAEKHNLLFDDSCEDKDIWLDLIYSHCVEPNLGVTSNGGHPQVLTEFPASQASLANITTDSHGNKVAGRFELYIDGLEIANAYDELINPIEQRKRFEEDNAERLQQGLTTIPIDENLIQALHDMPASVGIAVGIDRLLMLACGTKNINEVICFTTENS